MHTQERPSVSMDEPALEQSSAGVMINGKSHVPVYNPSLRQWYVDTELNAFDTYVCRI